MALQSTVPEECYASIVEALLVNPGVAFGSPERRGFGSSALTINDKIFAMLVNGKLVVKLPRQRVDALVASGEGERFDPGHGRLMTEWVAIEPTSEEEWQFPNKRSNDICGGRTTISAVRDGQHGRSTPPVAWSVQNLPVGDVSAPAGSADGR